MSQIIMMRVYDASFLTIHSVAGIEGISTMASTVLGRPGINYLLYFRAKASLNSSLFKVNPSSSRGRTFSHPEAPLLHASETV